MHDAIMIFVIFGGAQNILALQKPNQRFILYGSQEGETNHQIGIKSLLGDAKLSRDVDIRRIWKDWLIDHR